eukprot:1158442-Pelagomonas_calceolata.AAC.5
MKPPRPSFTQLEAAPTYRPTPEEFQDPFTYINSIRPEASRFGICRIGESGRRVVHGRTYIHTHTHTHTHTPLAYTVPPAGWDPPFALEKGTDGRSLDSFQFQTRKQLTSHLCMRAPRSFDTGHWVCSLVDIDAGQVHLLTPWAKCVQIDAVACRLMPPDLCCGSVCCESSHHWQVFFYFWWEPSPLMHTCHDRWPSLFKCHELVASSIIFYSDQLKVLCLFRARALCSTAKKEKEINMSDNEIASCCTFKPAPGALKASSAPEVQLLRPQARICWFSLTCAQASALIL